MDWWGPAHRLERFEKEDELTFQTVKLQRKGEAALALAFSLAALLALGFNQLALGLILGFVACLATHMWFSTTVRRLVVTSEGLKGDSESVTWREVFELRYESGGEDGPSGLCARTSLWRSKCVFQDVTRDECREVEHAIYSKWPNLPMAPRPEGFWRELTKAWRGRSQ